jgi:serine/threonine-protein kinase
MRVTTVGRFTVERLLSNHGTTAQVYLAHDGQQQVALKIVRGKQAHLYQDHLRQEVETLRRFDHPGVVRLYPVLDDDVYTARVDTLPGQPWYFAMEYLQPLSAKRFPLTWRLQVFRRLVESVAYLHSQGYAHGDLKPDHILLRYTPDGGDVPQPVLIDFGSACSVSEPPLEPTASIPYAAPELLRVIFDGESPDALRPVALDTWALGAILYEWATGQRLVSGFTRRAVVRKTINGHFNLEKAPASVRSMLATMLHVQPEARVSLRDIPIS